MIDSVSVVLDQRNLRTPSKNIVKFPKKQRELALLTAAEWDAQTKNLKAHTLPLVNYIWIKRSIDLTHLFQYVDFSHCSCY